MRDSDRHVSRGRLQAVLALALFGAALWVLRRELGHYRYHDLIAATRAIDRWRLAAAVLVTIANYFVLTLYDVWALRVIGRRLGYPRVALASFVAYVFSHNAGLSFLGGGAVRFRLYASWGLTTDQIAGVLALNAITFWIGFALLAGIALLAGTPFPSSAGLPPALAPGLGAVCLAIPAAYGMLIALRRAPLKLRGREFALPSPPMASLQLLLSTVDWVLAAAVLYLLLPLGDASFPRFLGVFLCAQLAGVASHVPAGVGVFESVFLVLLGPQSAGAAATLGALIVYRVIYYLLPFALGVALLGGHEAARRRRTLRRVGRALDRLAPAIVPQALAFMAFAAGAVLLLSGATPALESRLGVLGELIALPVIEMSHFVGSVAGIGLLLLARGLQLRLDAAYVLAATLLGVGSVASLLKGFDYEEALILAGALLVLLPCRRHFYRRASLSSEPFTTGWLVAIALVVIGTGWLMALSYRHVEYDRYLWWEFELSGDAPRSLRSVAGVLGLLAAYGASRLLRPAVLEPPPPVPTDVMTVRRLVTASPVTSAHLALLGDKRFLLDEAGSAFLMYAIEGRSWVAMGDPIGAAGAGRELAWRFCELADRNGGLPVFYEVGEENLPLYLDLGMALFKLGEEARVPLAQFSLDGGARKSLRQTHHRLARAGIGVEIVQPPAVTGLVPTLAAVSDQWLAAKRTREKGFSLGSFSPAYLEQLPVAVARLEGRVVAFANLWPGPAGTELSVDLMRHTDDAPPGVMDYLFIELMLWGKAHGYATFNLGMAPLSGLEQRARAPLWSKIGALVFQYGDTFYNFQGLRQYKQKFAPTWRARYLASPGGVALPVILANVASLVSRGLTGVVKK